MRILMLCRGSLKANPNAPAIGGAGRQCLKLSKALVKRNVDVSILTSRKHWREPAFQKVDGIDTYQLNTWKPLTTRRGFRRLDIYIFMIMAFKFLLLNKNRYDIIHSHSALFNGFIGVFAARWLRKKNIIKIMNSGYRNDVLRLKNDKSILGTYTMAKYLLNSDKVVTLNSKAYQELISLGFSHTQIELLPNGVEVDDFKARSSYAINGKTRLIFIGRLDTAKRVDVLLNAMHIYNMRASETSCRLLVIGRGPLKNKLEAYAKELDLDQKVNFIGEVPEVHDYLSNSDIFVLPSEAEGISNVLLEAMASGLPCIASEIPGNQRVIKHNENGLLFAKNDANDLADTIFKLSSDKIMRSKLGRNARQTVEDSYNISAIAESYITLYNNILPTNK